jgi:hypothetical protein
VDGFVCILRNILCLLVMVQRIEMKAAFSDRWMRICTSCNFHFALKMRIIQKSNIHSLSSQSIIIRTKADGRRGAYRYNHMEKSVNQKA